MDRKTNEIKRRSCKAGSWTTTVLSRGRVLVLALALGLVGAGFTPVAQAADNGDYLEALDAEAGNVAASKANTPKPRDTNDPQQISGEFPPNLDAQGFENELRKQLFGSYLFYKKLSDANKRAVYTEYQKTRRIEDIRSKITNLFTGG